MRRLPLLLACLLIASAVAAGQPEPASMEAEIARIDRLATDPEAKLLVLQSMALDLGTHRNHLLLLKKQGSDSFGQIYVKELRKQGLDDAAVMRKLRAIGNQASVSSQANRHASGFTPVAYVGTTTDYNSAGTFVAVTPEVGIDSHRFAFVVGVPVHRISATQRDATGVGDVYASVFLRQPVGSYDLGAAFTIAAPTGNRDEGLGAGRVSVDVNGTLQGRFEKLRAFVTPGYTNSLYNNVGYQRPFISNGNSIYGSAGFHYRLHPRFTVGVSGFGVHAMGNQMVISQMTASAANTTSMPSTPGTPGMPGMPSMPPGHMPPGMGSGSSTSGSMTGGSMPFYGHGPETMVPGSDVSDWGASGWASWSVSPIVSLNLNVARSVAYDLTTIRVGLGFNLSRPISRLLRR